MTEVVVGGGVDDRESLLMSWEEKWRGRRRVSLPISIPDS